MPILLSMPRAKNGSLQKAILDEARRVLVSEGYLQLSMRRIASEVGCTATSIYLYFHNKDALIHALIDEGMQQLQDELAGVLDREPDLDAQLESLCRAYVEWGLAHPEFYEVMFMLHPKRMERYPARKYRRARKNLEHISAVLGGALDLDESSQELDVATTVIWSSLHGTVSLLIAGRVDVSLERDHLIDAAVDHALRIVDQGRDTSSTPQG